MMSKKSVTLRRLPAVSSFQMTGAQKSMRKLPFLRTPSAAALVSSPTTFVSPTKVTIVHPSNLAIAEDAELIEDELIE